MFSLSSITYPKMLIFGILAMTTAVLLEIRARQSEIRGQGDLAIFQDEVELTVQSLNSVLNHPDTCTDMLKGFVIHPGQDQSLSLNHKLDPEAEASEERLGPGSQVTAGGLTIYDLHLEVTAQEDMRTVINDGRDVPQELHRYPVEMKAQFVDPKGQLVVSAKGLEIQTLPFFVWTLPPPPIGTGEVVSCFSRDSVGVLCNDLGGYFVPHSSPYDQSCRLSLKTLRRESGRLVALGNCRIGGIVKKPSECAQFGIKFGANQIQGVSSIVPIPGDRFLCQICQ